jgi:cyclopropane fatty-acyl-phospholipid synthase-like methyltransferase
VEDLDTAQEKKLEHLCRKLRMREGERLLDIGCGWGALVMYAAEKYGVEAVGVTLSEPQVQLANARITDRELETRARVELRDYRDVGPNDAFDKIVSVGMFEHVGRSHLPEYFAHAWRLLKPGGLFLNHGIALGPAAQRPRSWREKNRRTVVRRYFVRSALCVSRRRTGIRERRESFRRTRGIRGAGRGKFPRALRAYAAALGCTLGGASGGGDPRCG